MNYTNTMMVAIFVALAAVAGLVGMATAIMNSATPAHAKINQCPTGDSCSAGGTGQQGGGSGGHTTQSDGTISQSGGAGHFGGSHYTEKDGQIRCVGHACL